MELSSTFLKLQTEAMRIKIDKELLPYRAEKIKGVYDIFFDREEYEKCKIILDEAFTKDIEIIKYFIRTGLRGMSVSDDKLPFIISVSCVVGAFQTTTCFAESWLEKSGGGAIAMMGSTVNQDWNPPMMAQDYMADILVGGYNYTLGSAPVHPDHQKTHFGSITLNGKILMYAEAGDAASSAEMLNWCLFGDPSLQVRTDTPQNITLSDSTVTAGPFTTNVKVNGTVFPNALVSIWDGANQPFSGYTDASGNVTITHTLALGKAVTLTVTGFNLYPKIINTTITSATALPTENVFSNTVSVYPIPASKNITVSIDNSIDGKYTFEILNTLGQVVFTDVIEKNSTSFTKNIDLSNISKGVYLMKYSGNGNVGYKKLILN